MKNGRQFTIGKNVWAVITGASGGLGTSFSLACARRGFNLLLIDLPDKHLGSLADFICRNFPLQVKYLEMDLSLEGFEEKIIQQINQDEIKVKMLINNAGMNQNGYFEDTDIHYLRKMIELNESACISLTKALLPELRKNRDSYIINVSSFGSFYPLPRKTCYAATKGFVRQFSQALRMEIAKYGIHVSVLCPGPMTTNIDNYILHRNLSWIARKTKMHPDAVAEKTIRDTFRNKEIIVPGRINRILKFISSLIPDLIRKKLTVYSMHQLEKNSLPVQKEIASKIKKPSAIPV